MNIEERRNLKSRILSALLLLLCFGVSAFAFVTIVLRNPDDVVLMYIAILVCAFFNILEIAFILKGGKKETILKGIAFNENDTINNFPVIVVGVGTVFSVGLITLSLVVYNVREEISVKCGMMVILSIASYLFINCLIYYFYLLMFRKREINLRDFIK